MSTVCLERNVVLDTVFGVGGNTVEADHPDWQIESTRSTILSAVAYLATHRSISPQIALEWIMQEARAKRATLSQVAEAIINEQEVPYRYSAPV